MTKIISTDLFNELRRVSSNITMAWKLTRKDGLTVGFTQYDVPFDFEGITYTPANAFSGTSTVARSTMSVDNMNAVVLTSEVFTERDLRGGRWADAKCQVFWICPAHPEWGVVPLRGGTIGEIKISNGKFETELRSISQKLQQPFGDAYNLTCPFKLGDPATCKVKMDVDVWKPNTKYYAYMTGEAGQGDVVRPSTYTGFWFLLRTGTATETQNWGPITQYGNTGAESGSTVIDPNTVTFTPGAVETVDGNVVVPYGTSGGTEPTWGNAINTQTPDNDMEWLAIYARIAQGTVTVSELNRMQFSCDTALAAFPDTFFQFGTITWVTGNNTYFTTEIKDNVGAIFYLRDIMPEKIQVGDTFTVTQGCTKVRAKCRGTVPGLPFGFDNMNNFGGYPDIPTEDKALVRAITPAVAPPSATPPGGPQFL